MSYYYDPRRRGPWGEVEKEEQMLSENMAAFASAQKRLEDTYTRNRIANLARELYVDEPGRPPRECFTLAEEFFAHQDEWFKEKKDSPHEGKP